MERGEYLVRPYLFYFQPKKKNRDRKADGRVGVGRVEKTRGCRPWLPRYDYEGPCASCPECVADLSGTPAHQEDTPELRLRMLSICQASNFTIHTRPTSASVKCRAKKTRFQKIFSRTADRATETSFITEAFFRRRRGILHLGSGC